MDTSLRLPQTEREWSLEAEKLGALNKNIHEFQDGDSASKIGMAHFLGLRVLWKIKRQLPFSDSLGIYQSSTLDKARESLESCDDWKAYLCDIELGVEPSEMSQIDNIGVFTLVRYYQLWTKSSVSKQIPLQPSSPISNRTRNRLAVIQTPMRPGREQNVARLLEHLTVDDETPQEPNKPPDPITPAIAAENFPAEDEKIVNNAFILFVNALTVLDNTIRAGGRSSPQWTMKGLQLKFGEEKGQNGFFQAYTDGFLRVKGPQARAIVETKPYVRKSYEWLIQIQESAEMAAWIRNCPEDGVYFDDEKGRRIQRRLLVSQDYSEIYLTVAEFDSKYEEYLRKWPTSNHERSFMVMKQYGPWNTIIRAQMTQLGEILLAFTLEQCSKESSLHFKALNIKNK